MGQKKSKSTPDEALTESAEAAPAPKAHRDIVLRWGNKPELLAKGFVAVPVSFLSSLAALKPFCLTPSEALFVIDLMAHKWDDRAPYPGYKKLATWMGKSESYVRKLARSLERKKLLVRRARVGRTNEFDLQPLFDRLSSHLAEPQKKAKSKSTHTRKARKNRSATT